MSVAVRTHLVVVLPTSTEANDAKWFGAKIQVIEGRATGNTRPGFGLEEPTEVHGEMERKR